MPAVHRPHRPEVPTVCDGLGQEMSVSRWADSMASVICRRTLYAAASGVSQRCLVPLGGNGTRHRASENHALES